MIYYASYKREIGSAVIIADSDKEAIEEAKATAKRIRLTLLGVERRDDWDGSRKVIYGRHYRLTTSYCSCITFCAMNDKQAEAVGKELFAYEVSHSFGHHDAKIESIERVA